MQKLDSLNQVAQFHQTFGAPILAEPTIPSKERCGLRVSLLAEELDELKEAIAANDLVEIADALCDLQYVLSGAYAAAIEQLSLARTAGDADFVAMSKIDARLTTIRAILRREQLERQQSNR
jgi:predicted Zn-dependent protease